MTDAVDALVTELSSAGVRPAELSSQFRAVPRELFIPDRVWVGDDYDAIDRADEPEKWLNAVYSNVLIVTQFDDGKTLWPRYWRSALVPDTTRLFSMSWSGSAAQCRR